MDELNTLSSAKPIYPTTIQLLSKGTKGSREYYKNTLLQKSFNDNKLRYKWETISNTEIFFWQKSYLICLKTIHDNYLILFQYRILNQILEIRSLKFKMGILPDNMSKLCNKNEETLVHLFCLHEYMRKFGEHLAKRIKTNATKKLNFSSKGIILAYQDKFKQMWPINILFMMRPQLHIQGWSAGLRQVTIKQNFE